ncbi:MAG: hypothetical protein RLZZ227_1548 [Pseudomonadota bacterium]|jgi:hypothetical protein
MTYRLPALLCIALVLLPAAALPAAEDPRDFSGVWQAYASSVPLDDAASAQLTPEGEVLVADFAARFPNAVEPAAYCIPAAMPEMMTASAATLEVLHSYNRLTLLGADGAVRRIFLDDRTLPPEQAATRLGYSIGRWENDTLVIETTALDDMPTGRWPRTENTTVVERVTKTTRDRVSAAPDAADASATLDNAVLALELTLSDATLYREPQRVTLYYQHLDTESPPESDCATRLWMQALEAANQ